MLAAAAPRALWYLSRGTGLVALLMLTGSVVLGITESMAWEHPHIPRFITAALHKNLSLLATAFLGLHIVTSIVDGFAPIRWVDAVVPFVSSYRPLWLGLGAVAVDLLLALVVTSLLRRHLGYRVWRAVHWAAYACWPVALVHGLGTGTDTRLGWVAALSAGCLLVVTASVLWRLVANWDPADSRRLAGVVASIVIPLAVLGWMVAEPMQPGWAKKAGTPSQLIRSQTAAGSTGNGSRGG